MGDRYAKGGTRTPKALRLPDPKSGASANSATFASHDDLRLTRESRGRDYEIVQNVQLFQPYATIHRQNATDF